MRILWLAWLGLGCGTWLLAAPLSLRVVAANLTSDTQQSYSPDNGSHDNPEGAGARILTALKPDVVLIQEFNTRVPVRQWVNATFGPEFHFAREETPGIPNGVISRYPIAASGKWADPNLTNRGFFWARIRLPDGDDLWVVSLHLHAKSAASRVVEVEALFKAMQPVVPADARLVIGGDLNTRDENEACLKVLRRRVVVPDPPPADGHGITATNRPRNRPYDWVLACAMLDRHAVPVRLAGREFPHGLVFDSRVFEPLAKVAPVRKEDSDLPQMQHMAVVRDFLLPEASP